MKTIYELRILVLAILLAMAVSDATAMQEAEGENISKSVVYSEPIQQGSREELTEWREGFLSNNLRDGFALVGFLGVVLTAIGVWLAYVQMKRTTEANQAATKAALQALEESRKQYDKYAVTQASRLLNESGIYVKHESWDQAASRLRDLAEILLQIVGENRQWIGKVARQLHDMETSFIRVAQGKITFDGFEDKWIKLDRDLRARIAEESGPFSQDNMGR